LAAFTQLSSVRSINPKFLATMGML
jgi:hypothetical protein